MCDMILFFCRWLCLSGPGSAGDLFLLNGTSFFPCLQSACWIDGAVFRILGSLSYNMKHLEMTIALYKYNWTEFQQLQVAPYRKQTMSQVKKMLENFVLVHSLKAVMVINVKLWQTLLLLAERTFRETDLLSNCLMCSCHCCSPISCR